MAPDRSVLRRSAGPVRVIPGLALLVVSACGTADPHASNNETNQLTGSAEESAEPVELPDAADSTSNGSAASGASGGGTFSRSVEVDATPLDPADSRPDEIRGLYTLRIPSIDVQAPVVNLEMGADRVLIPPRDPGVVGWWSQGAAPGNTQGSALLVGHSVSTGGGVFDDVDRLTTSDTVEVDDLTFTVTSVEVMAQSDLARRAEELFDQSVPGRLVIVTCEDWDGESWQSNAVAIATP